MKKTSLIIGVLVLLIAIAVLGIYNGLISKEQTVEKSWAQVEADYQRRADLIPNLVSTVQGVANFEQQTLIDVVEARAKATSMSLSADELTSENISRYAEAQSELSTSLGRLLVTVEAYPTLTASESFRGLQTQLEGTENRIAVSRKDFNNSVELYNTSVKKFPSSVVAKLFGFDEKVYFESEEGADIAPDVEF